MDRIICLVGESGCGKSTIAEVLAKEGYNYIQSYTDRPKRNPNEKGHIFLDISFEEWIDEHKNSEIIAETFFDKHHYWSTKEQYEDKGVSIYTVDPRGVEELKRFVDDAKIIAVYLRCDEANRILRMRKDSRTKESIIARVENDREIFKIVECDYTIDANKRLNQVVELVKCIINF